MKKILSLLLVFALALGVLVACKPNDEPDPQPQVTYNLDAAANYLNSLYKDSTNITAADYEVVAQVMVQNVKYTVEWSVDSDKVTVSEPANYLVTIGVDEQSTEEVPYKLTATIKAGDGTSKQVSFDRVVPAFACNTHEEYMNAAKGDMLTVMGVVTAINSIKLGNKYNHLFLKDTTVDGGYYCYKLTADPEDLGIKVGMTVAVTGEMSPYNGMQEIFGGQVAVLDTTIKTVEPLDITAQFTAGADLGAYVGLPVVIKGVEIGEQDLVKDTSQYLYFSIGEEKGYVRTYVTDFPAGMLTADDKATIDADHAAHFGYKADAAGILVLYSGAPYLIPMSVTPFTNYVEQIKTPAEKVEAELGGVKIDASFSSDTVIELPAVGQYYDDVTLTWVVDDTTGAAVIAEGKLTITVPNAELVVNLTVTATCGETTDSKTIAITLSKSATPLKELVALGESMEHNTYTEVKYVAAGIITEVKNETYGNIVITDESGASLLIYGTFINGTKYGESTEYKPVAGDYVVVCGPVGQYNGTAQIKNADILSSKTPDALKDVAAAGAAQEHNTYTENPFLVTGVVSSIANAQYGNLYLKDAEGNELYFYGLYDQTGARFDAMANAPAVGDTITVLGVAGQYNGTAQVKNGTLVCVIKGTTDVECEHTYTDGVCTKCGEADPDYVPGGDTPVDPVVNGVELTVDSLALPSQSYTAGTVTVNGVPFEFVQMGNYGDGIQMRDKDGKTSIIWNTAAFTKAIAKIELVFSDSKSTYDNADAVIFSFGNAADSLTYTTKLSTVAGTKTYTITPDAETYTFFKMEHDLSYTMYWKSITIVYVDGTTEGGDTPVECEHTYTDGVCTKCGEADPNYVPPVTPDPEPSTTYPVVSELHTGDKILIGAPAYGKLLSMVKVATYYNKGVDYTATDFSNVTDDEIFVVTVNEDGSIELVSASGKVVAIGGYSSLDVTGANKTWTVEAKSGAEGIFYLKNNGTGKYLEWYASKDNWSSYNGTLSDLFELSFYLVEAAEGGEVEPPHEHVYVEGKCECGAEDPNYVPPHEHVYVEGKCECGAEDPDYVAPNPPAEGATSESLDIFANTGVLAADSNSISWESDNFTFVNEKNTSTSNIRVSDADHFRVYKYNKTTISATNGKSIAKIVITCTNETQVGYLTGTTYTSGLTVTSNGLEVTFTVDAGSIDAIVIEATNNQWRLNKIVVYFA